MVSSGCALRRKQRASLPDPISHLLASCNLTTIRTYHLDIHIHRPPYPYHAYIIQTPTVTHNGQHHQRRPTRPTSTPHAPQLNHLQETDAHSTQVFFAVIILGLSANLVKTQAYGGAPSITNYEVFLGIWLFVIALIGIAADFIGALGGIVMVALDGLSLLFTFAGGVVSSPPPSSSYKSSRKAARYPTRDVKIYMIIR